MNFLFLLRFDFKLSVYNTLLKIWNEIEDQI